MGYNMIIYKVTNISNNKVYIGQTAFDLKLRKYKHEAMCNTTGYYFHNAIKKYGPKNFDWEIICTCSNKDELNNMEKYYISEYKSNDKRFGYNMTLGGESPLGRKHKESSKIKMSIAGIGRKNPHTEEWNKKIGLAQKGEKNHMYGKTGRLHPNSLRYKIIFPNGKEEEIIGMAKFCRKHNLQHSLMSKVVYGKRNHHQGFKCIKLESLK